MKLKIAKILVGLGLIASLSLVNWGGSPIVLPNQYAGYNLTPQVAIGSEQHTVWIYTDYNFGFVSLLYAHASINGTWTAPYEITSYNKFSADKPGIAVDGDSVHVVYATPYGEVKYFYGINGTWSAPVTIGSGFGVSITVSAGVIYVAWSDIRNNQGRAYFNWKDTNWHTEKAVTSNVTSLNRGVDIAVQNNVVHIVSQQQISGSTYKVSYVRDFATGNFNNDRLIAQELGAYDLSLGGGISIETNPVSIVWGASISDNSEPLAITQSNDNGINFVNPIYADAGYNILAKNPDIVIVNQKPYITTNLLKWNGVSVTERTVWAYHEGIWTQLGTNPSNSNSITFGQNILLAAWSSTLDSNDYIFYNTQQFPNKHIYLPLIIK